VVIPNVCKHLIAQFETADIAYRQGRINHIGQTGQMPGASRFWGPRAWISKHCFTGFYVLRLFTTRQNCRVFDDRV